MSVHTARMTDDMNDTARTITVACAEPGCGETREVPTIVGAVVTPYGLMHHGDTGTHDVLWRRGDGGFRTSL